jgi:hypothetical protein
MKPTHFFPRAIRNLFCWITFGCALSLPAGFSEPAKIPRIRFSYFEERISEAGTIKKTRIAIDALTLNCQPPYGWQPEVDEGQSSVRFRSLNLSAAFSITVLPKTAAGESSKDLRTRLGKEFGKIEIVEEFPAYTAGPAGIAFELKQDLSDRLINRMIVAYFPSGRDLIELKLAAPDVTWSQSRRIWSQFLNSFSIGK